MRKVSLVLLVAIAAPLMAQESPAPLDNSLQIGGVTSLVADKLKEAQGAGIVDLRANFGAGAYLPVWTFHDVSGVNYFRVGLGGKGKAGERPSPLAPLLVNLPGLSSRLWGSQWAKDHVTRTAFPEIWLGPYIEPPLDRGWTWRAGSGVMLSVGFGNANKGEK